MPQLLDLALRASAAPLLRRQSFKLEEYSFRDNADTGGWTFTGTASVVDHAYPAHDQFGVYNETIRAGAFDRSLKDLSKPISLFVNHQREQIPLANRAAGMKIVADPHLRVTAELNPKRPQVQEVRYAVEDGVLNEMSVGFKPVKAQDVWSQDYKSVDRNQVTLREVSIVEKGANDGGTTAEMRAFDDLMRSLTDCEMTKDEMRRAERALHLRYADLWDNQLEKALSDELSEMIGATGCYVCVVDHTDNRVIFSVYCNMSDPANAMAMTSAGIDEGDLYQLGYTADASGTVTLSGDKPAEVNAVTTYVVEAPEPDGRSTVEHLAERDRHYRDRLERLKHTPA